MLTPMLIVVSSAAAAVVAAGYLVLAVVLFEAKVKRTQVLNVQHRQWIDAQRARAFRRRVG